MTHDLPRSPRTNTRWLTVTLLLILAGCTNGPTAASAPGDSPAPPSSGFRVVTVVEGLSHPWGMAFLPGGDILVTERDGRLRIVRNGRLQREPLEGVPPVAARGQGGLLDVALHPDFATNRLVYLSYSKPGQRGATTAVVRGRPLRRGSSSLHHRRRPRRRYRPRAQAARPEPWRPCRIDDSPPR
jgi:glucose/arabinose dehydrogenase